MVESALVHIRRHPKIELTIKFVTSLVRLAAICPTGPRPCLPIDNTTYTSFFTEAVVDPVRKKVKEPYFEPLDNDTGARPTLFRFVKVSHAKNGPVDHKSKADSAAFTSDTHP